MNDEEKEQALHNSKRNADVHTWSRQNYWRHYLGNYFANHQKMWWNTYSQSSWIDKRKHTYATGENAFWLHIVWKLTLVASKTLIMLHFDVYTPRKRSNHKEEQTIFVYETFSKNFLLLLPLLLLLLFFLIIIFTILWIWLKLCIRKQQQIYSTNVSYACSNFVQVEMQTFAKEFSLSLEINSLCWNRFVGYKIA